jgi:hypothetical protein
MIAAAASTALTAAALTIVVLMVGTWVVSLLLKNASIVDIVWGFGFVCVAWAVRLTVDGLDARQNLLVAMTTVWGLRLAGYLFWRNHGKPEDYRYRAMRKHWGPSVPDHLAGYRVRPPGCADVPRVAAGAARPDQPHPVAGRPGLGRRRGVADSACSSRWSAMRSSPASRRTLRMRVS